MPSLIAGLEREASERKEPAAVGLVKFVKTYYFIACCKLLSKILPHINRLSLLFQREDVDLSAIRPNLNATVHAIRLYRESDIEAEQLIENELSEFGIDVSQARKDEFKENVHKNYVDSVILHFPHVVQVASFSLFDPSRLPDDRTKITSHGNEELEVLCDLYGKGDNPDVNIDALKVEWEGFKFFMCNTYCQNSMKAVLKMLVADRTISHLYPHLRKLAAIALVLPVSTAECESAFSTMNRVKTDLRNRLITQNLEHLMQISINGPCFEDYDFDKAATSWDNQRQRRIKL